MRKNGANRSIFHSDTGITMSKRSRNICANAKSKRPRRYRSTRIKEGKTAATRSGTGASCFRVRLGNALISSMHFSSKKPGTSQSRASCCILASSPNVTSIETPSSSVPGANRYRTLTAIPSRSICPGNSSSAGKKSALRNRSSRVIIKRSRWTESTFRYHPSKDRMLMASKGNRSS